MISRNFFNQTRILDGGMGQELLARGLPSNSTLWSANAILHEKYNPLVLDTHIDYIKAGAEIIVTTTFATRQKRLKENNLQDKIEFKLTITCMAFDWEKVKIKMKKIGLNNSQIDIFGKCLADLTSEIVKQKKE